VRVLLDEQLPRQLAPLLTGHDVRTVQQQSWAGLKNGQLLDAAEAAGFTVLVTEIAIFSSNRISPNGNWESSCSAARATLSRTSCRSSRLRSTRLTLFDLAKCFELRPKHWG
jgi:hypothetical protein